MTMVRRLFDWKVRGIRWVEIFGLLCVAALLLSVYLTKASAARETSRIAQLEREIEENSWVVAPLDTSIVFDVPVEERWAAALRSIGIDPGTLVDAGSSEPS